MHHDNALAYTSMFVLPYSQDLAPADFFLFPKLKTQMKGNRSKQELLAMPKSAFQKYFRDWKKRWDNCIISARGYIEDNKIVFLK